MRGVLSVGTKVQSPLRREKTKGNSLFKVKGNHTHAHAHTLTLAHTRTYVHACAHTSVISSPTLVLVFPLSLTAWWVVVAYEYV